MKPDSDLSMAPPEAEKKLRVKIVGVGTAGTLLVDQLNREEFAPASFAFINTDASAPVPASKQLLLEARPLRGFGTGGDPDRGRELAEGQYDAVRAICADTDVIFVVTGLGGGAGSGVTPVVARAARAAGALVLAFVTLPFECEGSRRQQQAQQAMTRLNQVCDGVICLPNQKVLPLVSEQATFVETFRVSANLLAEGLRGVWRLLLHRGLIEIHFDDLCGVLRESHGESYFATVEASGATRGREVMDKLLAHPLLEGGQVINGAANVLVSFLGGPDLSMTEVNRLMQDINQRCAGARVVMGAAIESAYQDRLAVTLIVTRPLKAEAIKKSAPVSEPEESEVVAELGAELLHPTEVARPKTRVVPPAPVLTADQREEIIAKQASKSGRGRKNLGGPRMRQTTLPLDIVNKGRFDKSEPTIHKGEDLDLPTYVRRGIALN